MATKKGRPICVFADYDTLNVRGSDALRDSGQVFFSIRKDVAYLQKEFALSRLADSIMGALQCLILAGYHDDRIKKIVKPYAISRVPKIINRSDSLCMDQVQEILCDVYRWPPSSFHSDPDYTRMVRLLQELFEEIILEYGGQEELDKIRRALELLDVKCAEVEA